MKGRFFIWALFLNLSLIMTGICIRALSLQGVSLSMGLITRGLSCLVLVIALAAYKRLSLIPISIGTQVFRSLVAGLALTFLTMSYDWLSASTVSVLSNIDVPLLIVLGPLVGVSASKKVRMIALGSISFLIWYVATLERQEHLAYGLMLLGIGSILLCFGYSMIKKSMSVENAAVTILVPALAIIFYGLIQNFGAPLTFEGWNFEIVLIAFLSGAGMFGAYYATMKLYDLTDLATAEFPTLISSILIQPIEYFLLHSELHATYLISSMCFVVATYLVLKLQHRHEEPYAWPTPNSTNP